MKTKIYEIIFPYEIYEYVLIGGIVIIPLSLQVLQEFTYKFSGKFSNCSGIDNCFIKIYLIRLIFFDKDKK